MITSMSLERALADVRTNVPECVAAGLVDVTTGTLLGIETVGIPPQQILDLVAVASGDLFQGSNVAAIEAMWRAARGGDEGGPSSFREIVIFSDNLLHVLQRCAIAEELVLVAVCKVSANLGMVLSKARMSLPSVESAL